jgi:uncharacterized repeat protein (TIGR03833 family)
MKGDKTMDITNRKDIKIGILVDIIADKDKGKDTLTRGYVVKIISQANNKKGVKVELQTGETGHVDHIVTKEELRLENFKFYNRFFFEKQLFSVWNKETRQFLVFEHQNDAQNRIEKTALLFDSEEDVKKFIKGSKYDTKDQLIRPIHRKKPIVELFSQTDAEFFRINGNRKLSKEKLQEWENYFKNMR